MKCGISRLKILTAILALVYVSAGCVCPEHRHCRRAMPHPALRASVKDFGATGDGVTDDTAAINKAIDSLPSGSSLYFPDGVYLVSSTISITTNNLALIGAGTTQTTILGNFVEGDILHFDGANSEDGQIKNILLENFRVDSRVPKTSGAAIHLENCVRSSLRGVFAAGQDGTRNLWDGIWMDKVDQIKMFDFEIFGSHDGLIVNGGPRGGPRGSDVFLWGGKIAAMKRYGVRAGGDVGGLYIDATDINNNQGAGVMVDQSEHAGGNRQIFFGPGCYIDGESIDGVRQQPGLVLDDPNLHDVTITGTWFSVHTIGIHVKQASPTTTEIKIVGGQNAACDQDAIRVDAVPRELLVSACSIYDCAGWGVNSTVSQAGLGGGEGVLIMADNRFRSCRKGDVTWDTIPALPGTSFVRTIADDSAYSFTPRDLTTIGSGGLVFISRVDSEDHLLGIYRASPGGSTMIAINKRSIVETTGPLAGTTGADGQLTVSAHTDGKIYIENRSGATVTVAIHLLAAYPGATVPGAGSQ